MEGDWEEEEETCPKASPLTLTGVTNGPKNRGNEKEVKVEKKKERDHRDIEQVHFESPAQEYQER